MTLASKPIHGVIQPSKSNPKVFLTSSGSCRKYLAQEELKSKEKLGPKCTASRRTTLPPKTEQINPRFIFCRIQKSNMDFKVKFRTKRGRIQIQNLQKSWRKPCRRGNSSPINRRLCCSIQQAFPAQQHLRKII